LPFGDQQDFCVEFEEEVSCPVNSLVACAALCRTGSFRSSQQCRFLQASAFLVAVNRGSVLPDDGHDETCVGGCFAVFRHRDKSSAPPRGMGRLAPSAYQSAGDEWQVQSKRPDRGPFLRGISRRDALVVEHHHYLLMMGSLSRKAGEPPAPGLPPWPAYHLGVPMAQQLGSPVIKLQPVKIQ
jgi:hypothetical protein